ncbi:MAG: 50S ribosomal protein L9 [Candidatus Hydrothermota bacterium]|nr:MAG: 50S ribosomal protein L9 [Candidatus Hydrothermae bacterium]
MKVILLKKIEGLGDRGTIVSVSDGYARNYLIPKKWALEATPSNLRAWQAQERLRRNKEQKAKERAQKLARKLNKTTVTIPVKVGQDGKLFGAVSSIDILNGLRQLGIQKVEKGMIKLEEPIRETGAFKIPIKLHPEVEAHIRVVVKPESA